MAQSSLNALRLFGVAAVESGNTSSLAAGTTLAHYRALAAVVEPSAYTAVNLDDAEMAKYFGVLEEAYTHATVLPAPPGTVFQSSGTLTRWLELHYFTLTEALSVIDGHTAARVSITNPDGRDEDDTSKGLAALAAESLRLLRTQAAATVTLPHADGDEEDGVVARASFLIDSQRWQSFQDTVAKEARRQTGLDFKVTGPWPPYDFVRMQFGT
ncbi:MAG: GvpL/GvpF family gas vesicle protein [Gemmatimonadaceae bacterium]